MQKKCYHFNDKNRYLVLGLQEEQWVRVRKMSIKFYRNGMLL